MSSPGLQGLRPWMIQRVSGAFIALYTLYIFFCWLINDPFNRNDWHGWVAAPLNNIALGLFMIAVLWHAWIGVRDIILDYVPNVVARLLVLTLVAGTIFGSALWGVKALFMVAFK